MNITEKRFYSDLYSTSKKNAGKRKIKWDLSREQFDKIVARADGKCEVTGIMFSLAVPKGRNRRPWAPSLDRRNSSAGYTMKNARLVCVAANLAMNEWGTTVLKRMAEAINGLEAGIEVMPDLLSVRDIKIMAKAKYKKLVEVIDEEMTRMVGGVDYFSAPCRCLLFTKAAADDIVYAYKEKEDG